MKKIFTLIVSLAFFSSAFAQWQFGAGLANTNKTARFSSSTFPTGGSMFLSTRSPSFLNSESDWYLNSGLSLEAGSAGMKTIDINNNISRTYDNCLIAHSLDLRFGRWLNDWIVYTEAIGGHYRIHSGYKEIDDRLNEEDQAEREHLSNSRVFRYGLGLGVGYQFNDEFKLELSTRFTRSGAVDYLDMESVRLLEVGTSSVGHTIKTSDYSDLITFGLTAVFTCWH
jgi:opacity protein-like surface antigen